VRFSDPLQRLAGEDPADLIARARQTIESTLMEWRTAGA
jgi:hypothetical protein